MTSERIAHVFLTPAERSPILNLLGETKAEFGLSHLFISLDLSVVRYVADRVLVMYLGRIVEAGPHNGLWARPLHPYTRALVDAVLSQDRSRRPLGLGGELPSAASVPGGCRFHPRCPIATDLCRRGEPPLRIVAPARKAE